MLTSRPTTRHLLWLLGILALLLATLATTVTGTRVTGTTGMGMRTNTSPTFTPTGRPRESNGKTTWSRSTG